ncbi:ParB/RepB/Spo0J family partition protein [Pseudanabaena sp. FACHB-723]|uniref:ParB/RepB/Spo0J family partition protein n=2 Tax=Pseudanabaena mucicola TaxID=71190 RepID=A0ABR7ZZT8_9CYAN|nr:ParB/RepB/Spo0J family partition protein [Pseudanabaena mucicola FACHB-723]
MKPKLKPNAHRIKLKNVALFDEQDADIKGESTNAIAISKIVLPSQQPRHYFDPDKMASLVDSVRTHGILEPVLLRSLDNGTYELVAGERRYRAAQEVGLEQIPAVVRQMSEIEAWQIALIENLQREDINPVEETEAILQLLGLKLSLPIDAVKSQLYQMRHISRGEVDQSALTNPENIETIKTVFNSVGLKWESFITSRLPLLKLPFEVLEALRQGRLEYTKAHAIAKIKDATARQQMLNTVIEEGLSLVQIRDRITALPQVSNSHQNENSFKIQVDHTLRSLKKSKIWSDPTKQERLAQLMQQIEELITDVAK